MCQVMEVTQNGGKVIQTTTICVRGSGSNNVCYGDIGGGLVLNESGIWTQIGIISFISDRGCSVGHPSGYIRTANYVD